MGFSTSEGPCHVSKWWISFRTGSLLSSMELRPSWYNSNCSSCLKSPRILGDWKLSYPFHNNPSPFPIGIKLLQSTPSRPYTLNTLSNITLQYMHLPSKWTYSFRFLDHQLRIIFLSLACCMHVWSLIWWPEIFGEWYTFRIIPLSPLFSH